MSEIKSRSIRLDDENWAWLSGLPGRTSNEAVSQLRDGTKPEVDTRLDEVLEFARSAPSEFEEACLRAIERWKSHRAAPLGAVERSFQEGGAFAPYPTATGAAITHEQNESRRGFDPASIPGVSTGPPLNAYCIHCEKKFAGAKGANTCIPCGRDRHVTAGNCRRCAEVAHAKKLQASSTGTDDPSVNYDWRDPT